MIKRTTIAALSLSAAGFAGIVLSEYYTGTAVIPVKNDPPTIGFGSTFREDGSPVQLGDTITPPQAVKRSLSHIEKDEKGLKQCVTAPLSQIEYDVLVDFAYQYGVRATCNSTMVREANAENYAAACDGYLLYKRSGGFDCSIPGNKVCAGVWKRNVERREKCLRGLT
jgi:GH24 family phage-related lysozyme (muramidase)